MTTEKLREGTTPESLMESFRGVSLVKMIAVTVVFHVVMIGSSSIQYLKKSVFGDTAKLTREENIARAVEEATSAVRKIAAERGLNAQDVSDVFASRGARVPQGAAAGGQEGSSGKTPAVADPKAGAPAPAQVPAGEGTSNATTEAVAPVPEKPKSTIEKQLEVKVPGPKLPEVGTQDDIF